LPPVRIADSDGDAVIRVALDTAAPDGVGALPGNIDVTCATATASLEDAVRACLWSIDIAKLLTYIDSRPQHLATDATLANGATPTFDNDQSTPDWQGESLNLASWSMWIYVKDGGGQGGTPFPAGTLPVCKPWVLKNDDAYGR
jgi:hypothetical protein